MIRYRCTNYPDFFGLPHFKMTPSLKIILPFLVITSTFTSSLPSRDLIPPNLPNSTEPLYISLNESTFNLTSPKPIVNCGHFRTPGLDLARCENAWRKIPLFGEAGGDVEFRHRHDNPPASAVQVNFRVFSRLLCWDVDSKTDCGRREVASFSKPMIILPNLVVSPWSDQEVYADF